jgi:hypothetical protein
MRIMRIMRIMRMTRNTNRQPWATGLPVAL